MKIRFVAALALSMWLGWTGLSAQTPSVPKNWFHLHQESDGFYGVSTEKGYEFVRSKGRKPRTVVVAVIDSGVDILHEDLKDVIWVNPREIPGNGIDDDGNGYVDDIHGWNFIGGKNGSHIDKDPLECTRIVAAWRSRFEGRSPKEFKGKERAMCETYIRAKALIDIELAEANTNLSRYQRIYNSLVSLNEFGKTSGVYPVTLANIETLDVSGKADVAIGKTIALTVLEDGDTLDELVEQLKDAVDHFETSTKYHYNVNFDPRAEIVGDSYNDSRERNYGNNEVVGPDALHGTHVAGIIAAVRNNGIGMDGVADNVRIMVLRAVPDGDERDKDVANAIRYAVDNGAHIINMSFGKAFSWDKEAVDEAVKYAESKGVLMIHAAGNDGKNIDVHPNFPNRNYESGGVASNWIEVGALSWKSTPNAIATFSNYGKKQVDIFAPGVKIYATIPGSQYRDLQGTSMAAPVVAGVAAAVWAYYPELTCQQLKTVLLKSAVLLPGNQVVPFNVDLPDRKVKTDKDGNEIETLSPMKKVSRTGGVVNLYQAFMLADKMVSGK